MLKTLNHFWHIIRRLSDDDAYEQYLKHHNKFHLSSIDTPPALSRKDFFKLYQDSQWQSIKRCC